MALNIYEIIQNIKYQKRKRCFDVFGLFSQFRACNVSVVASGVVFHTGIFSSLAQKLSGEAWGAQHECIWGKNGLLEMYLGVVGVSCIMNSYSNAFMISSVIFYLYGHI